VWQFTISLKAAFVDISPDKGVIELRGITRGAFLELCERTDITDPEMSAALADGDVTYAVRLDGRSREEAVRTATSAIRAALHAQGAHTPGWEKCVDEWIERSEITSRPLQLA